MEDYPLTSFSFSVAIPGGGAEDAAFQEVSGLAAEREVEEIAEGCENSFLHRLPRRVRHQNLVLKRGGVARSTRLFRWCAQALESDLATAMETNDIQVSLLDPHGAPLIVWSVARAWPVKMDVSASNAEECEVAIERDARSQPASVEAAGRDIAAQAVAAHSAAEPRLNVHGNLGGEKLARALGSAKLALRSAGAMTAADLRAWADAQLVKSRLARIRRYATFVDFAALRPGDLVKLEGVGSRFEGDAFLSHIRHVAEPGVWRTEVALGLSPQWFGQSAAEIHAPPAGGLIPAARGLQIGVVKKIDGDPDGHYRIKVALPLVDRQSGGLWMRRAQPYASRDAGYVFAPEIGDEVVVGFLDGDPAAPVVLSTLHSSGRRPSLEREAADGNELRMDNSGVRLKSAGDIELDAKGTIKISAQQAVQAEAATAVSLKGAMVMIN